MLPNGYAQYRTVTTQTASPGDLLLQLYQAAIKNIGQAAEGIKRNDMPLTHRHIMRAQEIIAELQRTLDHERGGEIATHLDRLYTYMLQRLLTANVEKDGAPLDEVAGLLRQLLAAWQVAARQSATAPRPGAPALTLAGRA